MEKNNYEGKNNNLTDIQVIEDDTPVEVMPVDIPDVPESSDIPNIQEVVNINNTDIQNVLDNVEETDDNTTDDFQFKEEDTTVNNYDNLENQSELIADEVSKTDNQVEINESDEQVQKTKPNNKLMYFFGVLAVLSLVALIAYFVYINFFAA